MYQENQRLLKSVSISFCSIKEGSRRLIFKELTEVIGLNSILFSLSWYLKNDFNEEIFRLIVFEAVLSSFNEASHDRTTEGEISVKSD